MDFIIDPSKRPRAIFHDRVYHPSDIPPPPLKKRPTGTLALRRKSFPAKSISSTSTLRSNGSEVSSPFPSPGINYQDSMLSARDYDDTVHTNPDKDPSEVIDSSNMKVEEKIARAYHKDLSWRKVLVKIEPDAHNNLIVRRMFANAFGWPVVKHLVDADFSDSVAARTRDEDEQNTERARNINEPPDEHGAETRTQTSGKEETREGESDDPSAGGDSGRGGAGKDSVRPAAGDGAGDRTASEVREAEDKVPALPSSATPKTSASSERRRPSYDRLESTTWSDRDWADSADESEEADDDLAFGPRKSLDERASDEDAQSGAAAGEKEQPAGPLSGAWNWTEKIVGKGGGRSPKSGGAGDGA
jgi:hypothetical protein